MHSLGDGDADVLLCCHTVSVWGMEVINPGLKGLYWKEEMRWGKIKSDMQRQSLA